MSDEAPLISQYLEIPCQFAHTSFAISYQYFRTVVIFGLLAYAAIEFYKNSDIYTSIILFKNLLHFICTISYSLLCLFVILKALSVI